MIEFPQKDYNMGQQAMMGVAERLSKHCEEIIHGRKEELQPLMELFFMQTDEDDDPTGLGHALMPLGQLFVPELANEKNEIIRGILRTMKGVMYVMASEVWVTTMKTGKTGDITSIGGKKSCLLISGENIEGNVLHASYEIDEDNGRSIDWTNPKIFIFGHEDETDCTKMEGSMTRMLPRLKDIMPGGSSQVH